MAPSRRSAFLGALLLLGSSTTFSQPVLRIVHAPMACLPASAPALVQARLEEGKAAVSKVKVTLHFRSASYRDFYRMQMNPSGTGYQAVLPAPSSDTAEVVYFLEAIDDQDVTARTPQYRVPVRQVAADCLTPTAPPPPGILLPEVDGAPPFPPGFEEPASEKKRSRGGAVLALGAAGAAALGIGVLAGGQPETSTPEPPRPPAPEIPPVEPPVPPTPTPVAACFELPRSAEVGMPVRMDASCSSPRGSIAYEWDLGDGRTRAGRVVTPIYSAPGRYLVELHVSRLGAPAAHVDEDRVSKTITITAGTVPAVESETADLAIAKLGDLSSRVVDGVLVFHITYSIEIANLGPHTAANVTVRDLLATDLTAAGVTTSQGTCTALPREVTCLLGYLLSGARATVRLEVDVRPGVPENTLVSNTASVSTNQRDPSTFNDKDTETTLLRRPPSFSTAAFFEMESSFVSTLITDRGVGEIFGSVQWNGGRVDVVSGDSSFEHRVRSASETVLVEGAIQSSEPAGEILWRFDFGNDGRAEPGSIQPLEGQVLGREPFAITFHLTGRPGERVRFTYRQQR